MCEHFKSFWHHWISILNEDIFKFAVFDVILQNYLSIRKSGKKTLALISNSSRNIVFKFTRWSVILRWLHKCQTNAMKSSAHCVIVNLYFTMAVLSCSHRNYSFYTDVESGISKQMIKFIQRFFRHDLLDILLTFCCIYPYMLVVFV